MKIPRTPTKTRKGLQFVGALAEQPGLPAQLLTVKLYHVKCGGLLRRVASAEKAIIHIDTDIELKTDGETGAFAYVTVRCRVTEQAASTDVLLDFEVVHQVAYRFDDAEQGEGFVRQNALFHAWPYARAMFSDTIGRMGLQRYTLPLLRAGVTAVDSELGRQERAARRPSVKKRSVASATRKK